MTLDHLHPASAPATLPGLHPLHLAPNARTVLERRYLQRDDAGRPTETPEALFLRVARTIAAVDGQYEGPGAVEARTREYYNVMADLEFLPNTPTLMNAGLPLGQLAACFVLPVGDSMEEIFDSVKHAALIHKSGGGTGFAFSRLRPANDVVQSTHGISSGPVSFMRVFDAATETIKQGGTRRGANMAVLRADHPDVLPFIHSKHGNRLLTNFNISVGITAAFMTALAADDAYALINPRDGTVMREVPARDIWDAIVQEAWSNGDPGLIFLDRINGDNPTPALGPIEGTNPCGEQPLLPYEACNLGSVNLGRFVSEHSGTPHIDYARLGRAIDVGVRFLDNVVDANRYPLPHIETVTRGNRKIGLGVMGLADMLIRLGIPYDSARAIEVGDTVAAFIRAQADAASRGLAEERGVFPQWERSVYAARDERYRNATRTTVAPTGTISIIAGASGGIEPLFALAFVRRNVLDGTPMTELNPLFAEVARAHGFGTPALLAEVAARGTLRDMPGVPEDVRRIFVTAHEIAPEWHVRMQAAFQQHTDNGVSKTVNLPHEATPAEVDRVYRMAYEAGCKGVTIYRDRSRETQVLNLPGAPAPAEVPAAAGVGQPHLVATDAGEIRVTVYPDAVGAPIGLAAAWVETDLDAANVHAVAGLTNLALRSGAGVDALIAELDGGNAISTAIAAVLREYAGASACPACDDARA